MRKSSSTDDKWLPPGETCLVQSIPILGPVYLAGRAGASSELTRSVVWPTFPVARATTPSPSADDLDRWAIATTSTPRCPLRAAGMSALARRWPDR